MTRRIFSTTLFCLGTGCGRLAKLAGPDHAPTHYVALIDHSGSMTKFRESQLSEILGMIASLQGGDLFEAFLIDEPLSGPPPVTLVTDAYQIGMNPIAYRRKVEEQLFSKAPPALREINRRLKTKACNKSAIVDAVELASRSFKLQPAERFERRVLTVFSDMYEELDGIDFRTQAIPAKRRGDILRQLQAEQRIPDLQGVEVVVSGIRIHPKSREHESQVEAFWLAFFQLTGAKTSPSHFGTYLRDFQINEELMHLLMNG